MSLLFADGFDGYASDGDRTVLDPIYDYDVNTSTTQAGIATGRISGKSAFSDPSFILTNDSHGHELDVSALSNDTTWIVGFAFFHDEVNFLGNSGSRVPILQFLDSARDAMVTVYVSNAANLNAVSGNLNSSTKLGVGTVSLFTKVWHYFEFKVTFDTASGSTTGRIDGAQVLTGSGVTAPTDSLETSPSYIRFGSSNAALRMRSDDLYICDSAGAAANDFLGDIGVRRLNTSGAGTNTDFTPNSGTNWEAVDEDDPDDDTSYVESSTSGHTDSYAMENPTSTPAAIHALQVVSTAKSDDGGAISGRNLILSGGTEGLGDNFALESSYRPFYSLFLTDPNTGSGWTAAGVDAVEAGMEVV